ncbi:hypothetical protein FKP32DRAFT_1675178 [Trametes sanguinea]|nr:hypothetical protein FKP32DRAFT_1675178 [Trametes sanguinea]
MKMSSFGIRSVSSSIRSKSGADPSPCCCCCRKRTGRMSVALAKRSGAPMPHSAATARTTGKSSVRRPVQRRAYWRWNAGVRRT